MATRWYQGILRWKWAKCVESFPRIRDEVWFIRSSKEVFARIEGVDDVSQISKVSTYLAGGFGGVVSQFAVYPVDTLKFRLQCSKLIVPYKVMHY